MASALGIIAVVLCLSLLEGLWAWLVVAAVSEVTGQVHPPLVLLCLVLAAAWLVGRLVTLAGVELERRRLILAGTGLGLALVAGTIHAGLVMPLQLVFGHYEPDLRGAGIMLLLAVLYLWGRGLAALTPVNRRRVLNHIGVAAGGLGAVLVFLPLTDVVREQALSIVLASFLVGIAGLLLIQLDGTESRQLSGGQWAGVALGGTLLVIVGAAVVTGAFSSGSVSLFGRGVAQVGRLATPVTDVVLLAAGYIAQYLYYLFRWLSVVFSSDPQAIDNAMRQAEGERPQITDEPGAPPEILTTFVAVFLTVGLILTVVLIYYRLIYRNSSSDDEDILEDRSRTGGVGLGDLLRGTFGRLTHLRDGDDTDDADARAAIRRHYRAFQVLMVRAGLPRTASQTPTEYAGALATALPAADAPVGMLTRAYVLARYAEPDAPLPAAQSVGEAVTQVRDALRSRDDLRPPGEA